MPRGSPRHVNEVLWKVETDARLGKPAVDQAKKVIQKVLLFKWQITH